MPDLVPLPTGRRVRRALAATLPAVVLATVLTPTARGDGTPWAGWTAEGPPGGPVETIGAGARLASNGSTTLLTVENAFVASDGRDRTVGSVPLPGDFQPRGVPAVLATGRIVVPGTAAMATSDDLGRHWTVVPLPRGVTARVGSGARTGPVFVDALHGIVLVDTPPLPYGTPPPAPESRTGPAVLATDDGGASWGVRRAAEPGVPAVGERAADRAAATGRPGGGVGSPRTTIEPPAPTSRVSVLWVVPAAGGYVRLVRAGGELALERSTDGGAGWQAVPFLQALTPGVDPNGVVVTSPGTTASGAFVLPFGDALLVSRDDLATFERVASPGHAPRVLCDPAGACLVEVEDPSRAGRRLSVPFDGTTFGAPRPALPDLALAPLPGVVVGLAQGRTVRSDDGGVTQRPTGMTEVVRPISSAPGRLVVRQVGDTLRVTRDGVAWSTIPAPPAARGLARVADAPGGLVGLEADGRVWRWAAGAWTSWDASAVRPTDLAATSSAVVVIGERGILRRADGRVRRTLRVRDRAVTGAGRPVPTVDGLTGVSARGRLVLAWTGDDDRDRGEGRVAGGLFRSTDAGRTWQTVAGVKPTDDLQIVDGGTVLRSFGSGLYASRDGGRHFALRSRIPGVGLGDAPGTRLGFSDARHGVVGGKAVTADGGRTFTPVLATGNVLRVAADGVLASGPFATTLLHRRLLSEAGRPRATLRVVGRPSGTGAGRTVRVVGRVAGVPRGTRVTFEGAAGATTPVGWRATLVTGADGRVARRAVRLHSTDRLVRVRVDGVLGAAGSTLGAVGRWVPVPR